MQRHTVPHRTLHTTIRSIPEAWGVQGGLPALRFLNLTGLRVHGSSPTAPPLEPFLLRPYPSSSDPSTRPLALEVLRLGKARIFEEEYDDSDDLPYSFDFGEAERWAALRNLQVR